MPRLPRNQIKSNFYHVIQRGVNRQIIFEEDVDYEYFLKLFRKYSGETNIGICAYCLMNNHYHLLIHDRDDKISEFMKKLNTSYAMHFNKKYERSGYLFQGRFIGKPINNLTYFKHLLWYIIRNPDNSKIADVRSFKWSSFRETYEESVGIDRTLIDVLFESREEFLMFITNNESPLSEKEREEIMLIEDKRQRNMQQRKEKFEKLIESNNFDTSDKQDRKKKK